MRHPWFSGLVLAIALSLPPAVALGQEQLPVPPVSAQDHIWGRTYAPVSLIVYLDFECPFCVRHMETMQQILLSHRSQINIVYRHFPLSFHRNAMPAAKASECVAKLKGPRAFWPYAHAVYAQGADKYLAAARATGVDASAFRHCVNDPNLKQQILDAEEAVADVVTGTPTTFVINRKTGFVKTISGAVPAEQFTAAIEEALSALGSVPPTEIPVLAPYSPPVSGSGSAIPAVDPKTDHIRGAADARISIVEYADFECPFCKREQDTMHSIIAAYPDSVHWVLRHYPLAFHQHAQEKAEAAECVASLGGNDAFWQFEDALFAQQEAPSATGLSDMAWFTAEVDKTAFDSCLKSGTMTQIVQDQADKGTTAGVLGTPANFIIDHRTNVMYKVDGSQPLSVFTEIIDTILKQ